MVFFSNKVCNVVEYLARCLILVGFSILLAACGGAGSGSSRSTTDAGSPENQPWKTLFAPGTDSIILKATNCTAGVNLPSTEPAPDTILTLVRGTNTLQATAVVGTTTYEPIVIGGYSTAGLDEYQMFLRGGLNSLVNIQAGSIPGANGEFSVWLPPGGTRQTLSVRFSSGYVKCEHVLNSLTRDRLNNFVPEQRLASFIAGTPTGVISSAVNYPQGCNLGNESFYTYSVSPAGDIKIDGVALNVNWFDNDAAAYKELASVGSDGYRSSFIVLITDGTGRDFALARETLPPKAAEFTQICRT